MKNKTNKVNKAELLTAVFEVKRGSYRDGEIGVADPGFNTMAVMRYIRLDLNCSRGKAIQLLKKELVQRHKTSLVKFMFWCDGYTANGGQPIEITLVENEEALVL